MFSETIELRGHFIDSLTLPKVLDQIVTRGATFNIVEFKIGQKRVDRNCVARLQGISRPALVHQGIRTSQLKFPIGDLALGVFHVYVNARVRIDPVHFRDGPAEIDGLLEIELRREGMVGHGRHSGQDTAQ